MTSYDFSKSLTDFVQFETRLQESGMPHVKFCSERDGVLTLHVDEPLTPEDLSRLQNFVATYEEQNVMKDNLCETFVFAPVTVQTTVWKVVRSWVYPGRINKEPVMVTIDSSLQKEQVTDTVSYRFYDCYNNITLAECTFSNVERNKVMMDIDTSKLPPVRSSFELHGRVNNSNAKATVYTGCVVSF
jgi:hypothetical protein